MKKIIEEEIEICDICKDEEVIYSGICPICKKAYCDECSVEHTVEMKTSNYYLDDLTICKTHILHLESGNIPPNWYKIIGIYSRIIDAELDWQKMKYENQKKIYLLFEEMKKIEPSFFDNKNRVPTQNISRYKLRMS